MDAFALYTLQFSAAVAFLLNSGFRILTLSSHVVPRGIRLPFELACHRDTDELVIIATRLNLLGKKACPSDTLPVLWRGQRRDGFAGLISRLQLWCLRGRGGGGGLKPMCNLMELAPAPKLPIKCHNRGIQLFFAGHLIKSEDKNGLNIWLLLGYLSAPVGICLLSFLLLWRKKKLHRTKAEFFRHLPDWCTYLLTWRSSYLGGQPKLILP